MDAAFFYANESLRCGEASPDVPDKVETRLTDASFECPRVAEVGSGSDDLSREMICFSGNEAWYCAEFWSVMMSSCQIRRHTLYSHGGLQ